jgi:GAF domain-containing protein
MALSLEGYQTFQTIAWFLALAEFILGLYILALNAWHPANRHISFLLLLTSSSTLLLGTMVGAGAAPVGRLPLIVMAAVTPALQPWILIVSIVLLKSAWLQGRWKLLWQSIYTLTFLPALLTLVDITADAVLPGLETHLYYTGLANLPAEQAASGFLPLANYTGGILGMPLRIVSMSVLPVFMLLPLCYVAVFDRRALPGTRHLAWLLLAGQVGAIAIHFGLPTLPLRTGLLAEMSSLLTSALFSVVYALAIFRQMISERAWMRRGSLLARITVLILAISLPILFAAGGFLSERASMLIINQASNKLESISQATRTDIDLWLLMNIRALEQLASTPEVRSMDAGRQKILVEEMAAIYPYMYLVSTTGMDGANLARSDMEAPKDYASYEWFHKVKNGAPLALETVIGLPGEQPMGDEGPALIVAKPIYGEAGKLAGVAMFASELTTLAGQITTARVGATGYVMVVDSQNRAIIHPDPAITSQPSDLGDTPPVAALRQGKRGAYAFTDAAGKRWRAYLSLSELNSDWGVIVQQSEAELLAPLRQFQLLAVGALIAGALLLTATTWLSIRQAIQPVGSLTATAKAIAAGDLDRVAPVTSSDEIGSLATAFNSMTEQLRELIGNLEQKVEARTAELERKAVQMQTSAQVAREAAAIRDLKLLLNQTTHLISDRFHFYHVGIFLIDESNEYAILQAANSQGGQRMLARGHKLQVGKLGIVGTVAASAKPRIALNVGEDTVFFNNPDLPLTRSEMALPMKARGQVIGVLDVQSTKEDAFTEEDVEVLQILADQIALAIENARLLDESQRALKELEAQYGEETRQAWGARQALGKQHKPLAFLYNRLGTVQPVAQPPEQPFGPRALDSQRRLLAPPGPEERSFRTIRVPVLIRNRALGSVILRKDEDQEPWSLEDYTLVEEAVNQISQALENARLFEESRRRAHQERVIGEIAAKAQRSLDLDTLMKTTVREISLATGAATVQIRLASQPDGQPAEQLADQSEAEE